MQVNEFGFPYSCAFAFSCFLLWRESVFATFSWRRKKNIWMRNVEECEIAYIHVCVKRISKLNENFASFFIALLFCYVLWYAKYKHTIKAKHWNENDNNFSAPRSISFFCVLAIYFLFFSAAFNPHRCGKCISFSCWLLFPWKRVERTKKNDFSCFWCDENKKPSQLVIKLFWNGFQARQINFPCTIHFTIQRSFQPLFHHSIAIKVVN